MFQKVSNLMSFTASTALLTPDQMALADQQAIQAGISGIALMEAAGAVVANAVTARWSKRAVLVACGPGNNGGAGFVGARPLRRAGWDFTLGVWDGQPHFGARPHP